LINKSKDVVKNWFQNRSTIEFLRLCKQINNPNFKGVKFDPLLREGSVQYCMSEEHKKSIKQKKALLQ
jgi:hypothetical protein